MGQALRTLAIGFATAVAMAVGLELVRHFEDRIGQGADELASVGGRLWCQALDAGRLEAEVRQGLPWVLWEAWEAQEDALAEGDQR